MAVIACLVLVLGSAAAQALHFHPDGLETDARHCTVAGRCTICYRRHNAGGFDGAQCGQANSGRVVLRQCALNNGYQAVMAKNADFNFDADRLQFVPKQ